MLIEDALKQLAVDEEPSESGSLGTREMDLVVFTALVQGQASLADNLQTFRAEWATRLNERLKARDPVLEKVIAESGKERATVKKELENLMRRRGTG